MPLYVGLMSGTSMDGIEAVLLEVEGERYHVRGARHHDYPAELRDALERVVTTPERASPDQLGELDVRIGRAFAEGALALLREAGIERRGIRAIGSHGQTVLHRPRSPIPFTLQLGDPNVIAEQTGIDVVADFRRRDLAAGGEAAPLLPAFHAAAFARSGEDAAVVNIGGIGNVTLLPASGNVRGFDTGPGNCLMDLWARRTLGQPYDIDGRQAAGGRVDDALLERLLAEPYLALPFPKSTGRELFRGPWLDALLGADSRRAEDVQATLAAYTARTIADAILQLAGLRPARVYVCGGGASNPVLMAQLARLLPQAQVSDTRVLGIAPDAVEAAGFAWFAHRRLEHLPANLPSVTGARGPRILGGLYAGGVTSP